MAARSSLALPGAGRRRFDIRSGRCLGTAARRQNRHERIAWRKRGHLESLREQRVDRRIAGVVGRRDAGTTLDDRANRDRHIIGFDVLIRDAVSEARERLVAAAHADFGLIRARAFHGTLRDRLALLALLRSLITDADAYPDESAPARRLAWCARFAWVHPCRSSASPRRSTMPHRRSRHIRSKIAA